MLTTILSYVLFSLSLIVIGARFNKRENSSDMSIFLARSWLLGLVIVSYTFILLGTINLLYVWALLICYGIFLAMGLFSLRKIVIREIKLTPSRRTTIYSLAVVSLIGGLAHQYQKLSLPFNGYDSLAYHLYMPYRALFQDHTFDSRLQIPNNGLSIGFNSVRGFLALISGPEINWILNFNVLLLIVFFSLRLLSRHSIKTKICVLVILTILITIAGPVTWANPENDLALTLFFISSIEWILTCKRKNQLLPTQIPALLGFCVMIKVHSVVACLPLLILAYKYTSTEKLEAKFVKVKYIIVGLLPITIWSTKNYIQTGNPLFPLFQNIFEGYNYNRSATSNEVIIRNTWIDAATIFKNKSIDLSSLFTLQLLALASVLIMTLFILAYSRGRDIQILLMICAVTFLQFIYMGAIYRYYLYLLIPLVVLAFSRAEFIDSRKGSKQISMIDPKRLLMIVTILGAVLFAQSSINIFKEQFKLKSQQRIENPSNAIFIEKEGRQVRELLKSKNRSQVCLIGDGRAFVFWPVKMLYLETDLSNPFIDLDVDLDRALEKIAFTYNCDLVVIHVGWNIKEALNAQSVLNSSPNNLFLKILSNNSWEVWKKVEDMTAHRL